MNESATAGPSAPARELEHPDSLGSTLEDYRLALTVVAVGVLLTFFGFLWALTATSAAAHRRLEVEMDATRSALRRALTESVESGEQLRALLETTFVDEGELHSLTQRLAARLPIDLAIYTPAAGRGEVLIAGERGLGDETWWSDAVDPLRDAAAREGAVRAVLRGSKIGSQPALIAYTAEPVGGDARGMLLVRRRIDADLGLARGDRRIEIYVFDHARLDQPLFASAPAPWPIPGEELTVDRAMRLGSLAKRWSLPEPFQGYEVVQVTHPRAAALSIENASVWLTLGAGLLVTVLLGYIAFGEARRHRVIRMEVQSTTAALRRSNEQLEQFAVVASHDLRSPLRAIAALAAFVARDGDSRMSDQALGHLKEIQTRIAKLSAMLSGLLEYARVGRHEAPAMLLDSGKVARETTALLEVPPGFQIRIASDMPRIWSPRPPLELVFRNLVANAIKHHDRSEGRISIAGRFLDSELAEFTVADDGPGIPAEYRERIFNLFETLHPASVGDGIGLGLAMVRKAVQMNGGEVTVADAPGRGAEFVFTWSTVQRRPPPDRAVTT